MLGAAPPQAPTAGRGVTGERDVTTRTGGGVGAIIVKTDPDVYATPGVGDVESTTLNITLVEVGPAGVVPEISPLLSTLIPLGNEPEESFTV